MPCVNCVDNDGICRGQCQTPLPDHEWNEIQSQRMAEHRLRQARLRSERTSRESTKSEICP
ncbi:hypothetical protein AB6D11_00645 [Vibrio splendidus]